MIGLINSNTIRNMQLVPEGSNILCTLHIYVSNYGNHSIIIECARYVNLMVSLENVLTETQYRRA
jgi:hypothetical protein